MLLLSFWTMNEFGSVKGTADTCVIHQVLIRAGYISPLIQNHFLTEESICVDDGKLTYTEAFSFL